MRTTLRLVLPLIFSVAVVSLLFATYQVRTQRRALRNDLSRRAEILGDSLQESVEQILDHGSDKGLQRLVDRFGQREHLKGVALYDPAGVVIAITPALDPTFRSRPAVANKAAQQNAGVGDFVHDQPVHIYALAVHRDGQVAGTLAVFHDTTYIDDQVARTLRDSLVNATVQTVLIAGLALILVRWTLTGPLTRTANWLRTLRTGETQAAQANLPEGPLFDQIHKEVTHLARDLKDARATAEEEARLRESNVSIWTA
jgi:trehalose 6-phosphate synthase